jgi:hypothetical protein
LQALCDQKRTQQFKQPKTTTKLASSLTEGEDGGAAEAWLVEESLGGSLPDGLKANLRRVRLRHVSRASGGASRTRSNTFVLTILVCKHPGAGWLTWIRVLGMIRGPMARARTTCIT